MELILPSVEYKDSYLAAVKEFQADTSNERRLEQYRKLSVSELDSDFESYVEELLSHARGENLPEGWVPDSVFWLVDDGKFIGRLSIRHRLTEQLEKFGGHIGYDIRPSERIKGYGSKILELALLKAKELGIMRVLLTCDATNTASRKIIEKNGGILENQIPNPETGIDKLRFWIDNA